MPSPAMCYLVGHIRTDVLEELVVRIFSVVGISGLETTLAITSKVDHTAFFTENNHFNIQ
jgi:hypothetical protein